MNKYQFKYNACGRSNIFASLYPTTLAVLLSFNFKELFIIQAFIILLGLKLGLYMSIDYLFTKTLIKQDENLTLKVSLLKFAINNNNSFLCIEKDMVSLNSFSHSYGLYIVRNNEKWINRLFKNRIKLLTECNKYDISQIMIDVSNDFGLRAIDLRDIES